MEHLQLLITDLLNTYYTWTNNRAHKQLLLRLRQHCNVTVLKAVQYSHDIIEVEDEFQWTFYNSFFFALTTLSTIGQFTYVLAMKSDQTKN